MNQFLWPWESEVLIQYPWALTVFIVGLSFLLSIVSWKRKKKKRS